MKQIKTLILTVLGFSSLAHAQNPQVASEMDVVGIYFQSLSVGDFALLGSVLDDNIIWHQPGNGALSSTYTGKDAVFALFGKFMQISQGSFKIDRVHSIMSNGNLVTATLHFSAHKPGSSISMDGVDLMKVQNGKIVEVFLFSADPKAEDEFWM